MWQAMDVGDGGAGRETAEWVNVLLAAFWSILQPIVSRYFWKSRWQPVMTRQYYTICYLQGGQRWCGAIGSRTFKVCEVLASWWYFIKFSCSPQNWFDFIVPPATVSPAVESKSLQGTVIDERPNSPIEKRKRNLIFFSPISRRERETWNSFPQFREGKEKCEKGFSTFEKWKRKGYSFLKFREEKENFF